MFKHLRLRTLLTFLSAIMVLTGCGGGSQTRSLLYAIDFAQGNSQWTTVRTLLDDGNLPQNPIGCFTSWRGKNACTVIAPVENGNMILESPWWLDNNHAPPGAGYLNLLAFTYMGKPTGPADPTSALDLTNGLFVISMKTENLDLKGAQLLFWFQVVSPNGKYTNYALIGAPIYQGSSVMQSNQIYVYLPNDSKMWQCLGSSDARSDTYGCSISFQDAIKNVNNDFGLIIMPTQSDPTPNLQPSGKIFIESMKLFGQPSN